MLKAIAQLLVPAGLVLELVPDLKAERVAISNRVLYTCDVAGMGKVFLPLLAAFQFVCSLPSSLTTFRSMSCNAARSARWLYRPLAPFSRRSRRVNGMRRRKLVRTFPAGVGTRTCLTSNSGGELRGCDADGEKKMRGNRECGRMKEAIRCPRC